MYDVVLRIYTGTRYLHWYPVFTPTLGKLHLIYDLWHRYSVFTPVPSIYTETWHVTLDIWFMTLTLSIYTGTRYLHRHLACYTWYMIYDTGTRYIDPVLDICHTWHLTLTPGIWHAFMWYEYLELTSWPLTRHYHPWYLYNMTYSWLSLLRRLGMTIILLPDIWYSWTPVHLNPWNREAPDITPDIILLLTPVIG